MKLGSRFKRFIAYILDALILAGILFLFHLLLRLFNLEPMAKDLLSLLLAMGSCLVYFTMFEQSKYQATPGKILLKLYVTDTKGMRLSFRKTLIRYVFYSYITALPFACMAVVVLSSPEILSAAHSLIHKVANAPHHFESEYFNVLWMGIILLSITKPLLGFSMVGLSIVLTLTWFIPILFKSRRGMYEKMSGTVVLKR